MLYIMANENTSCCVFQSHAAKLKSCLEYFDRRKSIDYHNGTGLKSIVLVKEDNNMPLTI